MIRQLPSAFRMPAFAACAALLALPLTRCAPSVDPALKASVDQSIGAPQRSENFGPPAALMPPEYAEGQWIRHKIVDKKGRPSVYTMKILGREGDAWLIESEAESYSHKTITRLLAKLDRNHPESAEIRKVWQKTGDAEPIVIDGPTLKLTQGLYRKSMESMTVKWTETSRQDALVAAGAFPQCYAMDTDVSFGPMVSSSKGLFHSSVPINGLVKSDSEGTKIELLDFGMTGAVAGF